MPAVSVFVRWTLTKIAISKVITAASSKGTVKLEKMNVVHGASIAVDVFI